MHRNPWLAPWAKCCRPSGAVKGSSLYRPLRRRSHRQHFPIHRPTAGAAGEEDVVVAVAALVDPVVVARAGGGEVAEPFGGAAVGMNFHEAFADGVGPAEVTPYDLLPCAWLDRVDLHEEVFR